MILRFISFSVALIIGWWIFSAGIAFTVAIFANLLLGYEIHNLALHYSAMGLFIALFGRQIIKSYYKHVLRRNPEQTNALKTNPSR